MANVKVRLMDQDADYKKMGTKKGIVANIFGTGDGDSAARKLCNTAPDPASSYNYYERLRDNIDSSYSAALPGFAYQTEQIYAFFIG